MKFDIVIGNPPYTNDLYLDFVQLGYQLSSNYVCMITPAKWQAKGGIKNEAFRKEIVPHMSDIVFYPNSCDVFSILEAAGISYYLIIRNETADIQRITCIDKMHPRMGGSYTYDKPFITLYGKCVKDIIDKIECSKKLKCCGLNYNAYNVFTSLMICTSGRHNYSIFSNDGLSFVTQPFIISGEKQYKSGNYKHVFSANTEEECEHYISYINTRLIRFLILIGLCGNSVISNEAWRFVPAPPSGKFDHIFTDDELYKKYGLQQEEINIIESVIKERKQK